MKGLSVNDKEFIFHTHYTMIIKRNQKSPVN
nr:MAG TPA: hypothetical protein [Caudoviricetes sp.]